ncbi:primosomal protein N' [Streptomyces caniscabiei]|uniref:replication restart helicase PriA n=1 Tax=Streptomyces caniscabiei TaxID=2746961 RepID=UPI0029A638B3|nr:primosomal protein N' [Streptomyces caniscabiei]MDX2776255.1 primosomal protein N' [Streptomyces caniscabiei]
MHYYEVAPNQIVRASSASFTYASSTQLQVGQIVSIEVGKKALIGIILKEVPKPTYATKEIQALLDIPPLPEPLVHLAQWIASYYMAHLATVLQTLLPRGLQKKRRLRQEVDRISSRDRTNFVLNKDQSRAIDTITKMSPGTALLHGVTGSGKTQVYLELAKRALAAGRSVILLVPEIALTSQVVDEFSHHFDDILLTHSKQTEADRHTIWQAALTSDTPRIAIGPRSALFLPLKNIGLVIIDESHEPSFKQEQSPRYSALRAASILARSHAAKLVLGSATPTIADYYLAEQSDRPIIPMPAKARTGAIPPTVDIVDMTKRDNFKRHRFLSNKILVQIEETLSQGYQVLLFHNRRGTTSTTLCENCAWTASCPRCFTPLTLHADKHHLRCHICGHTEKVPTSCPVCHHADIIHKGIGTKLIEAELRKLYPQKVIARFDGDSEAGQSVDTRYADLYGGKIDIIIGTQVVAKGLDLPNLRAVGVIQADAGLGLPDYSASERTFQLLAQVVGRVGRSHHPTSVIIQSYQPTHPAIIDGIAQNYRDFYDATIQERKKERFPPFVHLLKLTNVYKTEAAAIKNAQKVAADLRQNVAPSVEILGPTPAFYERQHDTYRWQIILKSPLRADLIHALTHVPPTHWQSELDPVSLL